MKPIPIYNIEDTKCIEKVIQTNRRLTSVVFMIGFGLIAVNIFSVLLEYNIEIKYNEDKNN